MRGPQGPDPIDSLMCWVLAQSTWTSSDSEGQPLSLLRCIIRFVATGLGQLREDDCRSSSVCILGRHQPFVSSSDVEWNVLPLLMTLRARPRMGIIPRLLVPGHTGGK